MANNEDIFESTTPFSALPAASEEQVGSLSDYIARMLEKRSNADFGNAPLTGGPFSVETADSYHDTNSAYPQGSGRILHHLDSQLAGGHLEQYLPTASTRYHLLYDRLRKELTSMLHELHQYRQLNGTEYQDKIAALEQRTELLARKIVLVEKKLSKVNPFQSAFQKLQDLAPHTALDETGNKPIWHVFMNTDPTKQQMTFMNDQLKSIQGILETQLDDPCFSADQLGRLINQYDSNLSKAEKLMAELKQRQNLAQRLQTKLSEGFKNVFSQPQSE